MKIRMFTLPNIITLANLACGCAATVFALSTGGRLATAFWFVAAAAVCDFLDGSVARFTGRYSEIGGQLDSLADMVSFGVAPSAILFVIYRNSFAMWNPGSMTVEWLGWAVFGVALFSALRLAKFNIDTEQKNEFTGLPVPANALMIAALGWMFYHGRFEVVREATIVFAAVVSYLLICPVKMFSLKFDHFGWRGNELRYVFLVCCAALVAVLGIGGIPAAIGLYIAISTVRHFGLVKPGRTASIFVIGTVGAFTLFVPGKAAAQSYNTTPGVPGVPQSGYNQPQQLPGNNTGTENTLPGQRRNRQETDPDAPFFGEGSEVDPANDTVKKKRPKKPLESYLFPDSVRGRLNMEWTVDRFTNHINIGHIDTLQQDFQTQYPFMKKGVGSAYLGNLGAPSYYLNYFDRQDGRDHSFANPWNVYLRTMENTPFYNVKKPFTQFNYAWAGQKARQEEDFGAIHAQNYSPQTGFNVNYKSFGTKGIYAWQATRDKTLSLAFSHTGKRYTVHAGYIYNSIYNRENGGIVDEDDIIIDINEWEMSQNIPMRMEDPRNWIKNNTYFLTQSYGIPLRRMTEEHFTMADRPAVFVGHSLEYNRWVRHYEDTYRGTVYTPSVNGNGQQEPYYNDWYIDPAKSRDSIFEGQLSNRVFVQIQPWNRNGVIGVIDGGVGVDMLRYYQFSEDNYLSGNAEAHKENSYYAYAGANGKIKRYFDWAGKVRFHPFGYRGGDLEFDGSVAARVFIKGRPVSVSGNFRFSTLEPGYWEQNYSSNHFRWSNSFVKENETRFDVTLRVPHLGLEATGYQSVLGNKVYYGADYIPKQATDVVGVTGLYLREDVRIGIKSSSVNLNHRVMLQWSTDQKVVPVPMLSAFLSYYYEFNVVKNVLRLQIGVDGRYNTRYYAQGYNPGTAQFYNQRERQLGDYVWMDVFVNAKWKRMRILLKMAHLNDDMFGVRNYFSVLHYPMNRRILKVGISWNFYD